MVQPLDESQPADACIGTPSRPLRVAIIGSGPAGFYAAEALGKLAEVVDVDMFERLPTPFGLVRGGVAPDHQKIKNVVRIYERRAESERFRFLGNVTLGRDVEVDELRRYYDAIIYAVGAERSRRANVLGSDLPHSHPAPVFVGWYNGHPDYREARWDLSVKSVAVVGNGNVAIDVARILGRTTDELSTTDIADDALAALRDSQVEDIYILGRRGPVQAAFTPKELGELSELADADVVIHPGELELDEGSARDLSGASKQAKMNVEKLHEFAAKESAGARRRLHFRFLVSPEEVLSDERGAVRGVRLRHNELVRNDRGVLRPHATDRTEELEVGMVLWAIGYRGKPLPGVPFDEDRGVIANDGGRVTREGGVAHGEYVVGWARTGAQGLIGSHKSASADVVDLLVDDLREGRLPPKALPAVKELDGRLVERGVEVVRFEDWKLLDAIEKERGRRRGAPRSKLTAVGEMLDELAEAAGQSPA